MQNKKKIAFICVHNSCRSQIAEALGKKYLSDICDVYSAGTEIKNQINQDAVRLMKQQYGIDMEKAQYSKLFESIPEADIYISMGCNVVCPYVAGKKNVNWGLEDPTGMDDEAFLKVIRQIEKNVIELRKSMLSKKYAKVDKGICAACGACTKECPKSAISIWKGCYAAVDELVCIGCGKCAKICPAGCILTVEREVAES